MSLNDVAAKSRSLFGSFCDRMANLDLRAAAALPAAIGVCTALYGVGLEVHGQGELLRHGGHMAVEAYKAAMQAVPVDSMTEYVRLAIAGEHRSFGGNEQGVGFAAATAGPAFATAAVLLARGFQAMREFVSGRVNQTAEAAPSGIVSTFGGTSLALQSAKQTASTRLDNEVLARIASDQGKDMANMSIGEKGAVFYRDGEQLFTLCQKGSPYWNEHEAKVITQRVIGQPMDLGDEDDHGACMRPG